MFSSPKAAKTTKTNVLGAEINAGVVFELQYPTASTAFYSTLDLLWVSANSTGNKILTTLHLRWSCLLGYLFGT